MVAVTGLPRSRCGLTRRPTACCSRSVPSYDQVANAAVYAASDWAATMTATEINLTGGAVVD